MWIIAKKMFRNSFLPIYAFTKFTHHYLSYTEKKRELCIYPVMQKPFKQIKPSANTFHI